MEPTSRFVGQVSMENLLGWVGAWGGKTGPHFSNRDGMCHRALTTESDSQPSNDHGKPPSSISGEGFIWSHTSGEQQSEQLLAWDILPGAEEWLLRNSGASRPGKGDMASGDQEWALYPLEALYRVIPPCSLQPGPAK